MCNTKKVKRHKTSKHKDKWIHAKRARSSWLFKVQINIQARDLSFGPLFWDRSHKCRIWQSCCRIRIVVYVIVGFYLCRYILSEQNKVRIQGKNLLYKLIHPRLCIPSAINHTMRATQTFSHVPNSWAGLILPSESRLWTLVADLRPVAVSYGGEKRHNYIPRKTCCVYPKEPEVVRRRRDKTPPPRFLMNPPVWCVWTLLLNKRVWQRDETTRTLGVCVLSVVRRGLLRFSAALTTDVVWGRLGASCALGRAVGQARRAGQIFNISKPRCADLDSALRAAASGGEEGKQLPLGWLGQFRRSKCEDAHIDPEQSDRL